MTGVRKAEYDIDRGELIVDFDKKATNVAEILKTLRKAGYTADPK